ncbi:MAG: retropepsin-like domain-containing protein [Treponema sp.]|nr:retropepsin-like domain-containing protein [Treponema sp.]
MDDKNLNTGLSYTVTYSGLAHSLNTPVYVISAIKPGIKIQIDALWDTGASCSLIRPEVAAKLNLKPISKTLISTPTDKDVPSNIYVIHIYLPNGSRIFDVHVLEGTPNNCDMLIGMDVISLSDFAITNHNDRTMFSFRMPSMTEIDFCEH